MVCNISIAYGGKRYVAEICAFVKQLHNDYDVVFVVLVM